MARGESQEEFDERQEFEKNMEKFRQNVADQQAANEALIQAAIDDES
jgi:hypothetical protein